MSKTKIKKSTPRTCGSCLYFYISQQATQLTKDGQLVGVCKTNPPTVFLIETGISQGIGGPVKNHVPASHYPLVTDKQDRCRHHTLDPNHTARKAEHEQAKKTPDVTLQ